MTRAKTQSARTLTTDSRRFTQIDTGRIPFKNITAEASLDWARDPELVEGQREQGIKFSFVGRQRQTKTYRLWGLEPWLNFKRGINRRFSQMDTDIRSFSIWPKWPDFNLRKSA